MRRTAMLLILLAAGLAPARAGMRERLEAEATAALATALPAARFRGLGAWVQEPGNVSVCGEVSTDTGPETGGRTREGRWRAFFAARGTTGGWRAFKPQGERDGWRFVVNPTGSTAADDAACLADMRRRAAAGNAPPDADFLRRCPIEAAAFWIDQQMTCAGHLPPD